MSRINTLYTACSNKRSMIYTNYLFNKKYFYTYAFKLYYPVLIPRKCTEGLVYLLTYLSHITSHILDLCGGSGIITVSLILTTKQNNTTTLDYNYMCCSLSQINYRKNINIMCDVTYFISNIKKYTFISANPPYINLRNLDIYFFHYYKKKQALYSTFIGLKIFFTILNKSYTMLSCNSYLLFEHSYNHSKIIRTLLKNNGFTNIHTLKDLSNLTRFTYAEK